MILTLKRVKTQSTFIIFILILTGLSIRCSSVREVKKNLHDRERYRERCNTMTNVPVTVMLTVTLTVNLTFTFTETVSLKATSHSRLCHGKLVTVTLMLSTRLHDCNVIFTVVSATIR